MFDTVLAGFDGSARGEDALELGGLIARLAGAPLIAACVYDIPALSSPHDPLSRVLHEDAERIASQATRMSRDPLADAIAVQESSPARGLERVAAERGADLVVVGSSRRGTLGRLFLGSVPELLIHDARTAVAVAPAGYVTGVAPEPVVIGVGYDGAAESAAVLGLAAELARTAGARLHVIGVIGTRLAGLVPKPLAGLPHARYMREIEDRERRAIEEAATALSGLDIVAEPCLGGPAATLIERTEQLDLLVLGSHAYGALRRAVSGSVSTALVRSAACPLLVLPHGLTRRATTHASDRSSWTRALY